VNVFGAFTFGSLIKTFIPGLVWAFALARLLLDLHGWLPGIFPPLPAISGEEQTALVLAIPLAILLGLLSNIVVFMGVNDVLVRNPARCADPALFALYDGLCKQMRDEHWASMACANPALEAAFLAHADAEVLALKATGINELSYIREQYWYHMEFQVNMLLAVFAMLLALLPSPSGLVASLSVGHFCRAGAATSVLGAACILFRRAALKNYSRHVEKMCSLLASSLCARNAEQKSAADRVKKPAPARPGLSLSPYRRAFKRV